MQQQSLTSQLCSVQVCMFLFAMFGVSDLLHLTLQENQLPTYAFISAKKGSTVIPEIVYASL